MSPDLEGPRECCSPLSKWAVRISSGGESTGWWVAPLRRVCSPGCTEQHPGLLQGKASSLLLQHLLSTNKTGYKLLQVAEASRALVDLVTWAAEGGARELSWAPSWVSGVGLLHLQLL